MTLLPLGAAEGISRDVRAARQRRQGVGHDVACHLKYAQKHERGVTRSGSQRGRRRTGGRFINITDTSNGWPTAQTTGVTSQGMNQDIQSRDSETAVRMALHAEAEAYNALVRSWPPCVVARAWLVFALGDTRNLAVGDVWRAKANNMFRSPKEDYGKLSKVVDEYAGHLA